MKEFCCDDMKTNVYLVKEDAVLDDADKEDKVIFYSSEYDEYGIPIVDQIDRRECSKMVINHCHWCGKELPESKTGYSVRIKNL